MKKDKIALTAHAEKATAQAELVAARLEDMNTEVALLRKKVEDLKQENIELREEVERSRFAENTIRSDFENMERSVLQARQAVAQEKELSDELTHRLNKANDSAQEFKQRYNAVKSVLRDEASLSPNSSLAKSIYPEVKRRIGFLDRREDDGHLDRLMTIEARERSRARAIIMDNALIRDRRCRDRTFALVKNCRHGCRGCANKSRGQSSRCARARTS